MKEWKRNEEMRTRPSAVTHVIRAVKIINFHFSLKCEHQSQEKETALPTIISHPLSSRVRGFDGQERDRGRNGIGAGIA